MSDEDPVFDLIDVLLIAIVALGATLFCTFITIGIFFAFHPSRNFDPKTLGADAVLIIPAQVAGYILTVGFMVFILWQRHRASLLPAVQWNMPKGKVALVALAGGAVMALVTQMLSVALQRWIPKSLPIDQFFRTPTSAYVLAIFGVLVAPLVEELFFRGFLYPALARPLGIMPAITLTAGGFALLHADQLAHAWAPLLLLFCVGAVLTFVRARTKSVAFCVLMHMGYNFTLFTGLFIATQGFHHMERA